MMTEPVRAYIYTILVPLSALLVVYGILDDQTVTLWLGIASAILGIPATEIARKKVTPNARVASRNLD